MNGPSRHLTARCARGISYLFHPLFIPLLTAFLLLYGTYMRFLPPAMKRFDLLLVFLNTILLPLTFLHLFRRIGIIRSWQMEDRRERRWPVLLFTLLLFLTWLLLRRVRQPYFLTNTLLAFAFSSLLSWLITFRWKISLHLTGLGSLSAILLATALQLHYPFLFLWILSLLVAGLTATARLILRQHTPAEVYGGFFSGFITSLPVLLL